IALERLLGYPDPDGRITLTDDLPALSSLGSALAMRTTAPREDAEAASEARGDVRAAGAAVAQAEAEVGLQKALRIPDPALLVQYERDLSLPSPDSIGAGVSFTVPLLSRNKGGIRAAEVTQNAAARSLAQARARARADVSAARSAFEAATGRAALVPHERLPRAEKVEQTVAFAYEKGGASLLELLEAERNLNDLRVTALSIQAEALSAAADLAAAQGERLE